LRRITLTDYEKMIENGLKLHKEKKYAQEIRWYNKIIKIQPNWAGAYYRKGISFLKLLKYSEAVFWFDKSLDVSNTRSCPIAVGTLFSKGRALSHLSNYNEALFCYDKALDHLTVGEPLKSFKKLSDAMLYPINLLLTEKILILKKLVKKKMISNKSNTSKIIKNPQRKSRRKMRRVKN